MPYGPWFEKYRAGSERLAKQSAREKQFSYRPLISIVVPCYQTPEKYLTEMMDSVRAQSYGNWQLCLADATPTDDVEQAARAYCQTYQEPRIRYRRLQENKGIAGNTNEGIALSEGEWIALLDHDDLLAPEALYEMVLLMNRRSEEHTSELQSQR